MNDSYKQEESLRKIIEKKDVRILALNIALNQKSDKIKQLMNKDRKELEVLKRTVAQKERDIFEIRTALRWKIPNFFYKLYQRHVKKYLPRFIFTALNPLFRHLDRLRYCDILRNYGSNTQTKIRNVELSDAQSILGLKFEKVKKIEFVRREKPIVSIIIPVFNKWQFTYNCLKSLKKNVKKISYEIIIVDNASADETQKLFKEKITSVIYIRNEKNLNFVGGNNEGLKRVRGEYTVFLNNDTYILSGWLEALLETFQKNEKIGLVGSKLIYSDGTLQEAGGIVWKNKNAWNWGNGKNPNDWEFNYLKDVDYCSAASIMLKTELIRELGGFDPIYQPAYFEDTDLAFRVRAKGFRTVYQPKSELVHFEGVTAGKDTGDKKSFKKYQEINKEKFFERWKEILAKENFSDDEDKVFLARDRSKGKKVMLFMDNNVPTFDQDAGSFITFEYLKVFLRLGYKIVFWPHNLYKMEPYIEALQQMGIEVVFGDVSFKKYISENGKYFDVAVLSRPNVSRHYIDQIKDNSRAKIIYIPHDLHFMREMRGAEFNPGNNGKSFERTKKLELGLMKKSDISLVFSSAEEKIIKKEQSDMQITTMPWIEKIERQASEKKFGEREGLLFLGGFGHPPNVDGIKWFHTEIYPLIKKQIPNVFVTVVGSKAPEDVYDLDNDDFRVAGFVNDEDLSKYFESHRIFASPLRFGAGFKGKIAKSMANGLPVVTTSIGAEGMELVDEKNALIADTPKEFANAVVRLYNDANLWKKISDNSIDHVEKKYSVKAAEERVGSIITEL